MNISATLVLDNLRDTPDWHMHMVRTKEQQEVQRKPIIGKAGRNLQGPGDAATVGIGFIVLSFLVGFAVGCAVLAIMFALHLLMNLIWKTGAETVNVNWYPLAVCGIGGLLIGLWTLVSGNRVKSLEEVMSEFKQTGRYDLHGLGKSVVSFLLPLAFGGSVGFEAGLTGIIVAGCCWIRDRLKTAGLRIAYATDVSIAASLSAIFGAPFAGLVAGMEADPDDDKVKDSIPDADPDADSGEAIGHENMPDRGTHAVNAYDMRRGVKLILYLTAAIGAFVGAKLVAMLTGGTAGLPHFEAIQASGLGLLWALPCVVAAYVLTLVFHASNRLFGSLRLRLKLLAGETALTVVAPTVAGLLLGACALAFPYVLFPGEEQCRELVESWPYWTAGVLIATSVLKAAATPMCLNMGWMGGSFFPCIFSGAACGYGIAAFTGADPMLCVTVTTSAFLAGVTRKPILSIAILALCFPLSDIAFSGLAAITVGAIPLPKALSEPEQTNQPA